MTQTPLPLRPYIVGLTGGMGSGKSTAAKALAAQGAFIIDADAVSHSLTAPNGTALAAIDAVFPGSIDTNHDGESTLNRAALRAHVFTAPTERKKLEAILHPMIRTQIDALIGSDAALHAPYVLLVVPLLFESNAYADVIDCAVVIDVDEETQMQRLMANRDVAPPTLRQMIAAQMGRSERLSHAQFIINNNGDAEALQSQMHALHQTLLGAAAKRALNP